MIIPTLGNRPDLLRQTLESLSIQKIPFDLVMVCPSKSRAAIKLAKEFGASVVDDPGGLSAALNAGFAQAKSHHAYGSWIGDDDLIRSGSLEATVEALDNNPEAVVAYGYCDYIDEKGSIIFTNKTSRLAPWVITWGPNILPQPGVMFRLSSLKKAGEFDPDNKYSMDLDMFLRLRKIGRFVHTHKTLAAFRWHSDSTTVANRKVVLKETEAVKHKYLPLVLRPFAPLWDMPVRMATKVAARRVTSIARRKSVA